MSDAAERLMDNILDAWNSKDVDKLKACHTPDWVDHTAPDGMNDLNALLGIFGMFTTAFDDFELDIPKAVVDGDEVSYLYTLSGIHTGDFMGVSASGSEISIKGMTMLTMTADGKCAEAWGVMDMMGLMQQIGAVPVG